MPKREKLTAAELEELASDALLFLHGNAKAHGRLRARNDYMDAWVKSEKARVALECNAPTAAAAENRALTSTAYLAALAARQEAAEEWYAALFLREAAVAHIDAWRTACSNERAFAG